MSTPSPHEQMASVNKAIDSIIDSMVPNEIVRLGDFRAAVVALCPGVQGRFITIGIMEAVNSTKFMREGIDIKLHEDWDNRLSGYHEDDKKWVASLNKSRPIRKVV